MTQQPATHKRSGPALLATGLAVAGATLGAALLWPGGPAPVQVDLVRVKLSTDQVLYIGRSEVTVREWSLCHAEEGCSLGLRATGEGQDFPATGISFVDAQEYIAWINAKSGGQFRLPTKAEWFSLADEVLPEAPDPIFTAPELRWASGYLVEPPKVDQALHPTGAFSTAASGLRDLDGNVWEWTQDCYDSDSTRTDTDRCPAFILGGLHEAVMPYIVRDPANGGCASGRPPAHLGFRLVTDSLPDA